MNQAKKKKENHNYFNNIGEFKDAKKEIVFRKGFLTSQKVFTSFVFIIIGLVFMLLVFFDIFVSKNTDNIMVNVLLRTSVLIFCCAGAFLIYRLQKETHIQIIITALQFLIVAGFIGLLFLKGNHTMTGQFFAMALLMLGVSAIPSRWVYTLFTEVISIIVFVALVPVYFEKFSDLIPEWIEASTYLILCSAVGVAVALMIQKNRRKQFVKELELEESSITDSLTKVYNRFKFDSVLDTHIKKGILTGSNFSLIMYDIDNFKSFNDKYGHIVGDKILISISKIVSDHIRKTDFFARWGGEEFIVLLPNTSLKDAAVIAEKLRILIATNDVSADLKLTVSLGVTAFEETDDADTIIRKVDRALYKAKKEGKNRVEVA